MCAAWGSVSKNCGSVETNKEWTAWTDLWISTESHAESREEKLPSKLFSFRTFLCVSVVIFPLDPKNGAERGNHLKFSTASASKASWLVGCTGHDVAVNASLRWGSVPGGPPRTLQSETEEPALQARLGGCLSSQNDRHMVPTCEFSASNLYPMDWNSV